MHRHRGCPGGASSPLGDPPLFVGFLRGVDFFWTTTHLAYQTAIVAALVLAMFLALDVWLARGEVKASPAASELLRLLGLINLPLIACIIGAILFSAAWKPGIDVDVYGTKVELQNLVRDGALIVIALTSLWLTPGEHRKANDFTWEPIAEVAKLFAGIFVCIIPVLAALEAGHDGPFAWLCKRSPRMTARRMRWPISGSPASSRPSSTTRRLISCPSSSPAATRPN